MGLFSAQNSLTKSSDPEEHLHHYKEAAQLEASFSNDAHYMRFCKAQRNRLRSCPILSADKCCPKITLLDCMHLQFYSDRVVQ